MTTKIHANKENFNKLKKILNNLAVAKLKVGFFDGEKSNKSDLTMATIAKINEFGTSKIPARPFMRQTLNKNKNFKQEIEQAVRDCLSFKVSFKSAFRKVGVKAMQEMQVEVVKGGFEPNKASTIRKKKSSRPLFDKGQLRRSISWRLEK